MQHSRTILQLEANPEFIMQGIGVIAHDIETTAFERPFRSERGNDYVPAHFYRQQSSWAVACCSKADDFSQLQDDQWYESNRDPSYALV